MIGLFLSALVVMHEALWQPNMVFKAEIGLARQNPLLHPVKWGREEGQSWLLREKYNVFS